MIPLGVLASRRPAAGGLDLIPGNYTGTSAASVTTSSVDIGPASPSRVVVIALASSSGTYNRECTAMTIGGIAATRDVSGGSVRAGAHIFRAAVPSGTTADVVAAWSGSGHAFAFQVYAAQAGTSLIDTESTQSSTGGVLTVTPDSASGGTVIAVASGAGTYTVSSVGFATVDRTSANTVIGRSPGTGSPVTLTAAYTTPPPAGSGRLLSASYA